MSTPSNQIARRTFITRAAGLAACAALWPATALEAAEQREVAPVERAQWGVLFRLVAEMGEAVGYGLIANAVYDWLRSLSATQRAHVRADCRKLVTYGYIDPLRRQVPVYAANAGGHCAYHPVLYPDQMNGLVSFYDFCRWQVNACLAVPSILGIKNAVKEYCQDTGADPYRAAASFVPDRQRSASFGHFGRSYARADEYVSRDLTRVRVNYRRRARNLGEVRVIASINHLRGTRRIFDGSYLVNA